MYVRSVDEFHRAFSIRSISCDFFNQCEERGQISNLDISAQLKIVKAMPQVIQSKSQLRFIPVIFCNILANCNR